MSSSTITSFQPFLRLKMLNSPCAFPECRKRKEERAKALLEELGLGDRLSHKPSELSGGEQQRVSIARALANKPAVILADEPTGEVDSKTRDSIVRIFKELSEKGQTILVVTHDPEVAKECSRVLKITDGIIKDN